MAKSCPLCGTTFPDSSTFCPNDGTGLRTAEERDDLIGHTFCDRYVVTDRLGEGGMGTVYVARDVRLPQKVAVKVNRQPTASDKASTARFRQEAEAASRINHDRVARVFDFGFMDDGRPYIVMEYVEGKTLKALLDAGPLNPRDAATITVMIAEALNAAHRLNILHRDLKPENVIILDDTNGGMRVKVLDFGIAKVLGAPDPDVRTETGFVIGTPLWMSPEQLMGDPLDARSDVFALALLAFAMLTGHRAFAGENRQVEVTAPLSTAPHTLQAARPEVNWPEPLQALLNRTLSRNVADRPASALEFANEMCRIITEASTPATPSTATRPSVVPPPVVLRSSRVYAAAGAVAVLLVVALVFVLKDRDTTVVTGTTVAAPDSQTLAATQPAAGVAPVDTGITQKPAEGSTPVPEVNKPAIKPDEASRASANTRAPGVPATASSAPSTPVVEPGSDAADRAKLKQLMNAADSAELQSLSSETRAVLARQQLRELASLKLNTPLDQGFWWFYNGQARATLNEKDQACSAFARARSLSAGSPTLLRNAAEFQQALNCPPG